MARGPVRTLGKGAGLATREGRSGSPWQGTEARGGRDPQRVGLLWRTGRLAPGEEEQRSWLCCGMQGWTFPLGAYLGHLPHEGG